MLFRILTVLFLLSAPCMAYAGADPGLDSADSDASTADADTPSGTTDDGTSNANSGAETGTEAEAPPEFEDCLVASNNVPGNAGIMNAYIQKLTEVPEILAVLQEAIKLSYPPTNTCTPSDAQAGTLVAMLAKELMAATPDSVIPEKTAKVVYNEEDAQSISEQPASKEYYEELENSCLNDCENAGYTDCATYCAQQSCSIEYVGKEGSFESCADKVQAEEEYQTLSPEQQALVNDILVNPETYQFTPCAPKDITCQTDLLTSAIDFALNEIPEEEAVK